MREIDGTNLLAIVLMVKDEAQTMAATLRPLLEGGVRYFFIFDTGSTDETLSITQQILHGAGVVYHLVQEPFIDFSTSRNRALTLAEVAFPTIPFMLMPDAEWLLQDVDGLLRFCERQQHSATPLFMLKILMNNTVAFYTARLFRTTAKIRFVGVVHEVPSVVAKEVVPDEIYFNFIPSHQGAENSKARWTKDLTLLLNEYHSSKAEPNAAYPRTLFYLAQTYECLGHFKEAYNFYSLRASTEGWNEETFISVLKQGRLAEHLSKSDSNFSWQQAQQHYHHAFSLRPQRIEPLIEIANHYWPDNIPLCYLYTSYACDAPYPVDDILFIENHLYDYTRFEILSRCAWYLDEFHKGLQATQRALTVAPDTPHLLSNLKLYQQKLSELATNQDKQLRDVGEKEIASEVIL